MVVFQGAVLKTPGSNKGSQEEHDFVLVVKKRKLIIALESKRSLSGKTVTHGLEQLDKIHTIIQQYFSPMLTSGEWKFVKLMHFDKNNPKLKICPECESNLIFSEEDLRTKLTELHVTPQPAPSQPGEYRNIVKTFSFTILAQDIGTHCQHDGGQAGGEGE